MLALGGIADNDQSKLASPDESGRQRKLGALILRLFWY
jgi:hypothetical protein